MNWEAISAVGQIVGAIAVTSTLVYLALQIRYAKLSAADTNRLARAQGVREYFLQAATNRDLRVANTKALGLEDHYEAMGKKLGVSADEACIADHCHAYWFWLHWGQFTSTTEQKDLNELGNMVQVFYTMPPVRESWNHSPVKPLLDPPFVRFVDTILAECDKSPQGGREHS